MTFCDKLVPVLVILLFLYTYYAYVVELCILKITPVLKKSLYLVAYHLFIFLVAGHYFATMFIKTGTIPSHYRFGMYELEAMAELETDDENVDRILERFCYYRGIQTHTRRNDRIRFVKIKKFVRYGTSFLSRYCMKCKHIKPDRAHHCSTCRVCVLKMDHHCPWIDNCVHFYNYKLFFLLLIHTSLYCLYYVGTSAEYVYEFCIGSHLDFRELTYVVGLVLVNIFKLTN